jgi:signal transduction histidine kinase
MHSLGALLARVRALPPGRFDAGLAAVLLAEALFELFVFTPIEGVDAALIAATLAVMAGGLAVRRRLPVTALAIVLSGFVVILQIGGEQYDSNAAGPFFWMLFASYTVGAHTEGRHLVAGAIVGTALNALATGTDTYTDDITAFVNSVALGVAAPMLFAQVMRNRARLNHALRDKAQQLAESREGAAESAALEERTRIAGELHDVVAHALSAMTVQAAAARRLAERDPEHAENAFATVEATGREALTELRRLLGVLRREDEEIALAPQPSLAHVGSLARRSLAAGLPVELSVEGEPWPLSAGVDLTAYRLVQEALGRARDAEAGRAAVILRYEGSDIAIEIADDGAPTGRRLLGLRERVAVYGGKLQAGPVDGSGWRVSARLPARRAAAPAAAAALETPA